MVLYFLFARYALPPCWCRVQPSSLSPPASISALYSFLRGHTEYAPSAENQLLLLFADPFERSTIHFLAHESPGFRVPFRPALGEWIEDLRTVPNSSIAVTISSRSIRSHTTPLGMKKNTLY